MTEFVKHPNSPIISDGWSIIAIAFLIALLAIVVALALSSGVSSTFLSNAYTRLRSLLWGVAAISLVFMAFSLWFFRDPQRAPASTAPGTVLSAADGTVLKIEKVNDSRYGSPAEKISIFMSPFNVHVNRSPISGQVEKVDYVPGKFFAANLDKASTDNERNLVIIKSSDNQRVGFLQIAGFIARRIVCHVQPGDQLYAGQRYGMIRFGSRMEMFLPEGSQILVKPGDTLQAGHTVVARLAQKGAQ